MDETEKLIAELRDSADTWQFEADNAGQTGGVEKLLARAADEIERLRVENWQLKGALGYPVPGHIMDNSDFKCGLCEAKTLDIIEATAEIERLREALATSRELRVFDASEIERLRRLLAARRQINP